MFVIYMSIIIPSGFCKQPRKIHLQNFILKPESNHNTDPSYVLVVILINTSIYNYYTFE